MAMLISALLQVSGSLQWTASGIKIVLFRFSCSHPHACEITLCAVCLVSLGICASVVQPVLHTAFPSSKER